jgi:hypothetical protein
VNVNAVLGACPPDEARSLARRVREHGFFMTVGLMHDAHGQLDPGLAGDALAELYRELRRRSRKSVYHLLGAGWEEAMLASRAAPFRCRAGARYLYVDEGGVVAYCSQRRTEPGIPLVAYGRADRARAFATAKGCEGSCAIACARRASALDGFRRQDRVATAGDSCA